MPWCPKCKYEYQPQITICPDCGSELTEQAVARQRPAPQLRHLSRDVWKYAAITLLVPWVCYLMMGIGVFAGSSDISFLFILIGILLLLVPFIYGYRCRSVEMSWGIFEGWIVGSVIQITLSFMFVLVGLIAKPYKLMICLPLAIVASTVAMLSIWAGSVLRYCKQASQ